MKNELKEDEKWIPIHHSNNLNIKKVDTPITFPPYVLHSFFTPFDNEFLIIMASSSNCCHKLGSYPMFKLLQRLIRDHHPIRVAISNFIGNQLGKSEFSIDMCNGINEWIAWPPKLKARTFVIVALIKVKTLKM